MSREGIQRALAHTLRRTRLLVGMVPTDVGFGRSLMSAIRKLSVRFGLRFQPVDATPSIGRAPLVVPELLALIAALLERHAAQIH